MTSIRTRRIISIIIALAIIGMTLTSCTTKPKATPTKAPTKVNNDPNDLDGRTIRVLYYNVRPGLGAEPFKDKGYEGSKMTDRINQLMTDYNCKIEYVGDGTTHPAWLKMHSSILTGEPNTDIAYVGPEHVVQSVEKGGLYEVLNDYADILELDNPELWDQTVTDELYTIDGFTVGLQPAYRGYELTKTGNVMFFNKSLLEREALWDDYNLYEMQKNKTWTWDKLDEIGSKVTKDTDADGRDDQFGLVFNPHMFVGLNASNSEGGTQTGFFAVNQKNEALFLGREKPQLGTLNFMSVSGAKGKGWMTAPNYGQQAVEGPRNFFSSGHSAFLIDLGDTIQTFKTMKMKDTVGAVAVPMGPENDSNEYYLSREWVQAWVAPRGNKNPKQIVTVMKELCAPLYTAEESEIQTEVILSEVIGQEKDILDTYNLLGDPARTADSMETPFLGTGDGAIFSYWGNMFAIVEEGMTGDALNAIWGNPCQQLATSYWKKVMAGASKLKEKRAEAGK